MKAIFLDDLLHGSRWGLRAPIYDLILFSTPWSFRLGNIRVPIHFWHGDKDHLVPVEHARHQAKLIPGAKLDEHKGESHLGSLAVAKDILDVILDHWPKDGGKTRRKPAPRTRKQTRTRRRARA
jgi:pimeloyl-ACP methyl ester carboxylesterase